MVETQSDVGTQPNVETQPEVEQQPDIETQPGHEIEPEVETEPDVTIQPDVDRNAVADMCAKERPDANAELQGNDTDDADFDDSLLPIESPDILTNFEICLDNNFDHYVSEKTCNFLSTKLKCYLRSA